LIWHLIFSVWRRVTSRNLYSVFEIPKDRETDALSGDINPVALLRLGIPGGGVELRRFQQKPKHEASERASERVASSRILSTPFWFVRTYLSLSSSSGFSSSALVGANAALSTPSARVRGKTQPSACVWHVCVRRCLVDVVRVLRVGTVNTVKVNY